MQRSERADPPGDSADQDVTAGRWLSEDPAGLAEGPNLYAYVGNDPISGIDPLGDAECKDCAITVKCRPVDHPVKYLGANHCAAELRLESGEIIRREAGPQNGQLTGFRNSGPAQGATKLHQDPSPCEKVNCVATGAGGGGGKYKELTNNSTHWLNRLLASCGFPMIDARTWRF